MFYSITHFCIATFFFYVVHLTVIREVGVCSSHALFCLLMMAHALQSMSHLWRTHFMLSFFGFAGRKNAKTDKTKVLWQPLQRKHAKAPIGHSWTFVYFHVPTIDGLEAGKKKKEEKKKLQTESWSKKAIKRLQEETERLQQYSSQKRLILGYFEKSSCLTPLYLHSSQNAVLGNFWTFFLKRCWEYAN